MDSHSVTSHTEPGELEVPVELIHLVLTNIKDLTFLWTTCRGVSRSFARSVERIFIQTYLNQTRLGIDCGVWHSQKHGKVVFASTFTFDRIDRSSPSIAVFVDKEIADKFRKNYISRLRSKLQYGNPAHQPKFYVYVRHSVNDTAVPGLDVDYDKLEVRCDWVKLCSAFFREEREYERRMEAWDITVESALWERRKQIERGEFDRIRGLTDQMMMFSHSTEGVRKQLRRERISHEVLENDGVEWKWMGKEDRDALRKLEESRSALAWAEPYSDESGGDDEENGRGYSSDVGACEEGDDDWDEEDEGDGDGEDDEEYSKGEEDNDGSHKNDDTG